MAQAQADTKQVNVDGHTVRYLMTFPTRVIVDGHGRTPDNRTLWCEGTPVLDKNTAQYYVDLFYAGQSDRTPTPYVPKPPKPSAAEVRRLREEKLTTDLQRAIDLLKVCKRTFRTLNESRRYATCEDMLDWIDETLKDIDA